MNKNNKKIKIVNETLQKIYQNYGTGNKTKDEEYKKIKMKMTKVFQKYISGCLICGVLFLIGGFLEPATEEVQKLQRIEIPDFDGKFSYDFWLPFAIVNRFQFYTVQIMFVSCTIFFVAMAVATSDSINLTLLWYLSFHLDILSQEMEKSGNEGLESMKKNLIHSVKYHKELLKYVPM